MTPEERASDEPMNRAARDWLKAREIIAAALAELMPALPRPVCERSASAILARLAQAEPPLLVVRADEVREPDDE